MLEEGCIPVFAEDFRAIRHVFLYKLYLFPTRDRDRDFAVVGQCHADISMLLV